jgi:hypothetical protein
MKSGLESMFNQIRRMWADYGRNDKDFTPQEEKLKKALNHLTLAAKSLSKASEELLDVINEGK